MSNLIFKDCFTEDDNSTWDIDCFGYALALIGYSVLCALNVHRFNPLEISGGYVGILGGRAVAKIFRKRRSKR